MSDLKYLCECLTRHAAAGYSELDMDELMDIPDCPFKIEIQFSDIEMLFQQSRIHLTVLRLLRKEVTFRGMKDVVNAMK